MRVRIVLRLRPKRDNRPSLFSLGGPAPRRWRAMCGSVAAHLLLVLLVRFVSDQVAAYYADEIDWSQYRVEVLRLRVPEPVYFEPPAEGPVASATTERAHAGGEPRLSDDTLRESRRNPIPQGIELPPLPAADSDSAILRPDTSTESKARRASLPSLAFWARRDPLTPKSRPKDIVEPGRSEPDGATAGSGARPSSEIPNKEANQAAANVPAGPQHSNALLSAPPSAVTPLRDRTAERRGGVFDLAAGQPANIILLSQNPRRPGQVVDLPPGSRGARFDADGGNADGPPGGSATRDPVPAGNSNAHAEATSSATEKASPRAMVETSRASTEPARTSADQRSGVGAFIRIMHPPGGSYDVIVTHSGDRPEIPGVVRGLSGSPVYSAYIPVGDEREWVLAYCLPASHRALDSRYTVYVEAAAPLSAPFPITTVVRAGIAATMRPTPITFHGFLTAAGTFRDMQPEQPTPATREIAGTLDEWRFRPARRGNTPIEVEVLLILPATTERSDGPSLRGSAWRPGRSSYPETH